jgi:hypothetical protein
MHNFSGGLDYDAFKFCCCYICNDWLGVRVAGPNYFGEAFGIKRMLWTRRKFSHYNIE